MKLKFLVMAAILALLIIFDLTQFQTNPQILSLLIPQFRLPRLIAVLLAGIALSISGLILQTTTENPLADSGTLGLTSGASLGAVSFLIVSQKIHGLTQLYPLFALAGALLAFALIYLFAIRRNASNTKLLLTGVALTALFQALITLVQLRINSFDFQQVATWLSGDIWQTTPEFLALTGFLLLVALAIFVRFLHRLEILSLGEEMATVAGLDVRRTKLQLYLLATAFAMIGVLLVGGLGFVGLIAPHIASELTGFSVKRRAAMTALTGMTLLVVADAVSQLLIAPSSLPIGFVVAFIGAPYYIYLIQKRL